MKTTTLKPDNFLRPTHRKQEISSEILHDFKKKLNTFLGNIHEPSREGKQETDLRDFLNDALYKGKFYINKKETIDWAIYNGTDAKSKVVVLIEVKKTAEKTDMFTEAKPNVKAFHELVLYYLRERIDNHNHEIKHLIATNCHEWYIFNELWFNENIFTTQLKKTYQAWKLSGHGTDDFYKFHAKSYLETLEKPLEFCRIDVRDYTNVTDKKIADLYKILSPEHLLKQEIANDANKLNKPFYNELLYLIGIEERKDEKSNKKVIERLLPAYRREGSLLENTIEQLETKNALAKVQNLEAFGDTEEEQKYSVALELCITWLNRLLFLKLLEGQLVKYHLGDRKYRFLTSDRINDFDELGELFFGVLAKRPHERKPSVTQKFGDIPYLNSSLFEESVLESNVLSVEILKDRLELPFYGSTILKDSNGKTRKGDVKTLKYLLDFLDCYDFGSQDEREITADAIAHDRTINAAVLGLIFEKLNGYKDGSFFTPSFITMYMCRETLRRSVVHKFNDAHNWNCQNFAELHEHLDDDYKKPDRRKAYNDLLNSIRICDPAVGSGHFLVSALNEMIAIKAELKILQHPNGSRLKGCEISVENDELVVWEEETQKDFQYKIGQAGKPFQELQLVQETLFHEKRTIIENCLFGVDINPKSVSICQLRLWIELLKNAFYTPESNYLYLETLPNIDINIKTGNSLVSKYSLTEDLSEVFKKQKFSIDAYRTSVNAYKEANTKIAKAEFQKFINEIKEQFKETVKNTDPKRKKLSELRGKRSLLDLNVDMFGNKSLNDDQLDLQKRKFDKQIADSEAELADTANAKIYRNSFEWRFEFPEVLDENGDFVGFDVVVGNPPYFSLSKDQNLKKISNEYLSYESSGDIYVLFYEKGYQLLKPNGLLSFITSNKWLRATYGAKIREFLTTKTNLEFLIDFNAFQVFENASVDTNILTFTKSGFKNSCRGVVASSDFKLENLAEYINQNSLPVAFMGNEYWNIASFDSNELKTKLTETGTLLEDWEVKINYGIKTGFNEAFIIDSFTKDKLLEKDPKNSEILKPLLRGRDVERYGKNYADLWLINTHNGDSITLNDFKKDVIEEKNEYLVKINEVWENVKRVEWSKGNQIRINRVVAQIDYPTIYEHLEKYENELEKRADKGNHWSNLRNCAYLEEFDREKLIWAETMRVHKTGDRNFPRFGYDDEGYFTDKTVFICVGEGLKYLSAFFNSSIGRWLIQEFVTKLDTGGYMMQKVFLDKIPIPKITSEEQKPFIEKVNQILTLKKEDSKADTSELEAEIDRMVYKLYELTDEEILIVEGK